MMEYSSDVNEELMLDGNALAGMLQEIFGIEMTVVPSQCAGCGNEAEIGGLLAFIHGPGVVLRCPTCRQIILRIVQTPDSFVIDARGAAYLRLKRS